MEGQRQGMDVPVTHRCHALQMTEVDGQPTQQRRLMEYPNDT